MREVSKYPLNVFRDRTRRMRCDACHSFFAKCVSFEDKVSHKTATFFCENCYLDLHGQMIGEEEEEEEEKKEGKE